MLKGLLLAFRTYSRIPVPVTQWDASSMRYALCFFPLVGAVIAAVQFLWMWIASVLHCGQIVYGAVACAIPLLITGGIHMDGYCDTVDALSSQQGRERRLEILKDPHAGAFAVIFAGIWLVVCFACFASISTYQNLWIIGFGYILSRALSGLAVVTFPGARKKGMLGSFAGSADRGSVIAAMLAYILISIIFLVILGGWRGVIAAVVDLVVFWYYHHSSMRKFGGITGDLAGWFVQMAELGTVLVCALLQNVGTHI